MFTEEHISRMIAEGYWAYDPERAKVINTDTGEMLDTLEWLIKEIEANDMATTANIKIATAKCPKCGFRPVVVIEGKPTICPVCSLEFGGKHVSR